MGRRALLTAAAAAAAFLFVAPARAAVAAPLAAPLAAHPRDLTYGELKFQVPDAERYRHKLKNGVTVYLAEDHTLPLVNVQVFVRAGSFIDPPDQPGIASLTGTMLRQGGTKNLTAEQFDERADFLAARIASFSGGDQSSASLNAITPQLAPSLDLFFDMLRNPAFQASRLAVEKGNLLEAMKQRNDDAGEILAREWSWLLYGEDHYSTRRLTKDQLDALKRDDLAAFHAQYWQPANMILAVSGDVAAKEFLVELERRFAGWKPGGPKVPWPPPAPRVVPASGLYHVEKDIPQGKVAIGHLGAARKSWDNPDDFALAVMNDILGGGGFTSRITKRVRSDEGLAYGASSSFGIGNYYPGIFRISYASKNPTVAFAGKLCLEEMRKIQAAPVGEAELATSKGSFIETFPRTFESAAAIAGTFAADDYVGRPHAYWAKYRDNLRKVTAADVQRVARTYLRPEGLVFLVVGKWPEIAPGDANGKASMKEFNGGQVKHLPLRDPLTLKP